MPIALRSCAFMLFALLYAAFSVLPARGNTAVGPNEVMTQATAILDQAEKTGDFEAAAKASNTLFDRVVAWDPSNQVADFQAADFTRRLMNQLNKVGNDIDRKTLLKELRDQPKLSQTLAFLIKPEDNVTNVYQIIQELEDKRPKAVEPYASLAAAIAVVHDGDSVFERHINENTVKSPNTLALFDYFGSQDKRMLFGIKDMPAPLLLYVVNVTASIPEMRWALSQYAGDQRVGKLFFKIKYDYTALHQGDAAKAVDLHGYSLQNILTYGGVCADQAYFATTVGKAIGVPTAYTTGEAGDAGHAWVGFFENRRGTGVWDFNTGRYKEFQGVRGNVLNPQTRKHEAAGVVALTGQLIQSSEAQREEAVAMVDAARRLEEIRQSSGSSSWSPAPLAKPKPKKDKTGKSNDPVQSPKRWLSTQRSADASTQLKLIEAGLKQCPGYAGGWLCMSHLAGEGQMTLAEKQAWAKVLLRMCGQSYPDFVFDILKPMVASVSDVDAQNAMWNRLFTAFQKRFDLAAQVRMAQASMWKANHKPAKAGQCYLDVVQRYANAGPFIVPALKGAAKILRQQGHSDRILDLYKRAWSVIHKPEQSAAEYAVNSNWYRVGKMVEKELNKQGDADTAARVGVYISRTLGISPG